MTQRTHHKEKPLPFKKALIHCAAEVLQHFHAGASRKKNPRRIEVRLVPGDKLTWLKQQELYPKIFWAGREDNFSVAASGAAEFLQGTSPFEIKGLFKTIQSVLPKKASHLRFYGGIRFDEGAISPEWQHFGEYQFILPRFEWLTRDGHDYFACNFFPHKDSPEKLNDLLTRMAYRYDEHVSFPSEMPVLRRRVDAPSKKQWTKQVNDALGRIQRGKMEKAVLAKKTSLVFEGRVNPYHLLTVLMKETSQCFPFIFQLNDLEIFLGASPERLYKRERKKILTEAIAGTRPRSGQKKRDESLSRQLANSEKDLREHDLVVQMIWKQLKMLCRRVNAADEPSLLHLKGGHHLISRFKGELKPGIGDAKILSALHPTPAIAGSPTKPALDYIRKTETFRRGWYAAPFGYVGSEATEFIVAIRSGLLTNNELHLFAGAGIVRGSSPDDEWKEIEYKLSTFLNLFP